MEAFYNNEERRWDHWRAYHCHAHYAFTQFDTGEVICTASNWQKDARRRYDRVGVTVADHTDIHMPSIYTPDGVPIKPTWLGDRQRTFLIDHKWEIVIEIKSILYREQDQPEWVKRNVPQRLWGKCSVYWPSAVQQPFGPSTYFTRPRGLSRHELDHIQGIRAAIKAQENLGTDEVIKTPTHGPGFKDPVPAEQLFKIGWSDLNDYMKGRIKAHGITMPIERIDVPYFITRKPVEENGDRDE